MCTRNRNAVLNVFANVGFSVVNHRDHQQTPMPQAKWVQLVARQQGGGFIGIDAESRHECWRAQRADGQLEGDAIHQSVSTRLVFQSIRAHEVLLMESKLIESMRCGLSSSVQLICSAHLK